MSNYSWHPDDWNEQSIQVKSEMMRIVTERFSSHSTELKNRCEQKESSLIPILMSLVVVNGTKNEYYSRKVTWGLTSQPCQIEVFDASSKVLWDWCKEKPDRFLNFAYNNTTIFHSVIHSKCRYFRLQDDFPYLPLPFPFDFQQEHALKFVGVFLLFLLFSLILSFAYCHYTPLWIFIKRRYKKRQDQKELEEIVEIIRIRQERIKKWQGQQEIVQTTVL